VELRIPKIFNLRRDPFERADENSNAYWEWVMKHIYILYGAVAVFQQQIQTFKEFPQRQKPGAFNLERIMEKTMDAIHSDHR
jgi:arylsulfatase